MTIITDHSKKKDTKDEQPPEVNARVNLSRSRDDVPLNFKVPAKFKREFKTTAASRDISMVDLLQTCFQLWKEINSTK